MEFTLFMENTRVLSNAETIEYRNLQKFCQISFFLRTKMGLRAVTCQMKAYRNLNSKLERTGAVTDIPRSGKPRIFDVQVPEVFRENHT